MEANDTDVKSVRDWCNIAPSVTEEFLLDQKRSSKNFSAACTAAFECSCPIFYG